MYTFKTSLAWKLNHICEFLQKCSKENVEWFIKDSVLYGTFFESSRKMIAVGTFSFDEKIRHPPISLDISTSLLVEKLSPQSKSGCTTFLKLEENFLIIEKNIANSTLSNKIPCKIRRLEAEELDLCLKLISINHVGNIFSHSTAEFADLCSKQWKNCASVTLSSDSFRSTKSFRISFSWNENDKFVFENTSLTGNETLQEEGDSISLKVSPSLFAPWRKSLTNLARDVNISFDKTTAFIFAGDEFSNVKMCQKND